MIVRYDKPLYEAKGDEEEISYIFTDDATGKQYVYQDGAFKELPKPAEDDPFQKNETDKIDPEKLAKQDEERQKQIEKEEAERGKKHSWNNEEQRKTNIDEINTELDKEDNSIVREADKVKERERLSKERKQRIEKEKQEAHDNLNRQDYSKLGSVDKFKIDLRNLLDNQTGRKKKRQSSWDSLNKKYDGSTILKPGLKPKEDPNQKVPELYIYFDQSSSWTSNDVRKGNQILAGIKKDFVDTGLIDMKIFYWANGVTTYPPGGGGTYALPVIQHIRQHRPENVVVFTDGDTMYQQLPRCPLKGGVYFLFKNGDISMAMFNAITGRMMHRMYTFN